MDELAGHPWEQADELIGLIKREAVEDQVLPESAALVFHADGLSAILTTPTFVTDVADEVTDTLCHVVPSLKARGVVVVWPASYEVDGEMVWAMKVHRWDAATPDQMRTQIWPLPIHGTPDGHPFDVEVPDPWSRRLAGALTNPGPLAEIGVVDTTGLAPGFELLVAPGGALDAPMSHGLN